MANKSEISLTNKECLNSEVYEIEGKPRVNFYPFAYALNNNCLSDHCWYCLDSNDHLRRCTGCLSAVFCDKNCQSLGWKDHRAECKPLSCCDSIPDIEVRLLGRIVVRYKTIKRGKDKLDENFYYMRSSKREIMEVWCHSEILRNDLSAMKKFDDIYTRMVDFLGSKVLLSKDDVFELHCRDFINRHAISDKGYVQEIGKGLYLDLCAYDHSCSPNSIYTFNGFIATLRGLTTDVCLLDRSSTFYSYIDPLNSKQQRRKLLRDTWYFECHCSRCDDEKDNILSSMICPNCRTGPSNLCVFGKLPYKHPLTQIITCPKCNEEVSKEAVVKAVELMQHIQTVLDRREVEQMPQKEAVSFLMNLEERAREILPKINVYYCKIIQQLIPLIDPSDSKTLLDLHLRTEECVRFCFPKNHPAVAFHLRNIGVFYLRSGCPHQAKFYLEMAEEIFSFTLDTDHPMFLESESLLKDASSAMRAAKNLMLSS